MRTIERAERTPDGGLRVTIVQDPIEIELPASEVCEPGTRRFKARGLIIAAIKQEVARRESS